MDLNAKQLEAYNTVINGTDKIIAMLGEAGTGKTYTTSKIVKDYQGTIALTATTNKAKEVIANMATTQAYTTHSYMGFTMLRQGKNQYLAQTRSSEEIDLVIIDEVSMLPQVVWNTILSELKRGNIKKVLLLGDPIQLPAVGIGINLKNIDAAVIELTEQMRQDSKNLEIHTYFSGFRKAIENKDYNFNPLDNLPSCISVLDNHSEFANSYYNCTTQKKILAYSNSVVDKYNQNINGSAFMKEDEVIIDKPLAKCKNGDTVLITSVTEYELYYDLTVLAKGIPCQVYHFKTKSALTAYLESSKDDKGYWTRYDLCYNLKHQYACTIHKSQGSTYGTVFIDLTDINAQLNKNPTQHNNYARPISYNTYLRLVYVAMSRMTTSAVLFNGNKRMYNKFKKE